MDGDGYNAGCHLGWDLDSSTFKLDLETDSWTEPSMIRVKKDFHQARKIGRPTAESHGMA